MAQAQSNSCPLPPDSTERIKRCEDLINDANKALRDSLQVEMKERQEISALDKELQDKDSALLNAEASLDSWYHNPAIVGPVAAILGVVAYSLLTNH